MMVFVVSALVAQAVTRTDTTVLGTYPQVPYFSNQQQILNTPSPSLTPQPFSRIYPQILEKLQPTP